MQYYKSIFSRIKSHPKSNRKKPKQQKHQAIETAAMSCSPALSWRKWSLNWISRSATSRSKTSNFPKFLTCLLPNEINSMFDDFLQSVFSLKRLASDTKHQYLSPPVLGGSWQCAHACLHSKAGWRVFLSGSDPQRDASLQSKVLRNIQTCKGLVHLVLLATEMARSKPLAIYNWWSLNT